MQTTRRLTPREFMNALRPLEPVGTPEWTVPAYSDEWGEPTTLEELAGDALLAVPAVEDTPLSLALELR